MSSRVIGLVPARGGSKGLPRKNLAMVGSRSLLQRAIESTVGVGEISQCYVSSDDPEMLREAERFDAVPIARPPGAASSEARARDVVEDFLSQMDPMSDDLTVVYLQPTSPFRNAGHVSAAVRQHFRQRQRPVVSVTSMHQMPEKSVVLNASQLLTRACACSEFGANRQELTRRYYPNGAIYVFSVDSFRAVGDIPIEKAAPYVMGRIPSLDIDSEEDLLLARAVEEAQLV